MHVLTRTLQEQAHSVKMQVSYPYSPRVLAFEPVPPFYPPPPRVLAFELVPHFYAPPPPPQGARL